MSVLNSADFNTAEFAIPSGFTDTVRFLEHSHAKIQGEPEALKRLLFGSSNPFWRQGRARFFWLDQSCALVGFYHPDYQIRGLPFASFGYFNSVDEPARVAELFAAFEAWVQSLQIKQVFGPLNFKTCYDYRLRLDDFEGSSFRGEPAHPSYYPDLLRQFGYRCEQRYFTDYIKNLALVRIEAAARLPALAMGAESVNFVSLTAEIWRQYRPQVLAVVNSVFATNAGFMAVDAFDFEVLYSEAAIAQACPLTSFLILNSNSQPVGLCVNMPDPHYSRRLLVKTFALLKEYRLAGRTFVKALDFIFKKSIGYDELAFCLMSEDNMAHRLTRKYSEHTRSYGFFGKQV